MFRSLRDMICLMAAVLLTVMAAFPVNRPEGGSTGLSIPDTAVAELQQDFFNPGRTSAENFMEQNISGTLTVSLNGCDNPRCQSTLKAAALQDSISAIVRTASSCAEERHSGISRLNDYYVFGLCHIII